MNNLFEFAKASLHNVAIEEKCQLTHLAWQLFNVGELDMQAMLPVTPIDQVQFPQKPILLPPRDMPKRNTTHPQGIVAFFHAVAHIEFVAIYLAWDILYRFRGLPTQFYQDWLRIADEEVQHFELIRAHLQTLGIDYGDLPAHSGLWDQAQNTAHDLLVRLALVPRCMEAHGLDVTPALIAKFASKGDSASVAILQRILTDEVGHVERGSYWFRYVCEQRDLPVEATYRSILNDYYKGGRPKGPFNREMRIIAGFSTAEIDWLESNNE